MSIKTTREINRDSAIERILHIQGLAACHDYVGIHREANEPEHDVQKFVDNLVVFNVSRWTNEMLEDRMDLPFFRYSMFENYIVSGEACEPDDVELLQCERGDENYTVTLKRPDGFILNVLVPIEWPLGLRSGDVVGLNFVCPGHYT